MGWSPRDQSPLGGSDGRTSPVGSGRSRTHLSVAVVLVAVLVVGAVSVVSADADASFDKTVITEEQGDIVSIPVTLTGTDNATIHVGSNDVNYQVSVAVENGDGDDDVTLEWNTYTAGSNNPQSGIWSTFDSSDAVTNVDRIEGIGGGPPDANMIPAGEYEVAVSVNGSETAVSTVILEDASTRGATLYTAPPGQFGNSFAGMDLTNTSTVALDDVVVLRVNASGLQGLLAAQDGGTPTDRFQSLLGTDNASFTMTEVDPETNTNRQTLHLDASFANRAFSVIQDRRNDSLYVKTDETDLRLHDGGVPITAGQTFNVTFTIHAESGLHATDESVVEQVEFVERNVSIDTIGGELCLRPESGQFVSGSTTIAPGSGIAANARATGNNPFLKTAGGPVDENRQWRFSYDMSDVPNGTEFTLTFPQFSTEFDGIVMDCQNDLATGQPPTPIDTATQPPPVGSVTPTETSTSTPPPDGATKTTTAPATTSPPVVATVTATATPSPAPTTTNGGTGGSSGGGGDGGSGGDDGGGSDGTGGGSVSTATATATPNPTSTQSPSPSPTPTSAEETTSGGQDGDDSSDGGAGPTPSTGEAAPPGQTTAPEAPPSDEGTDSGPPLLTGFVLLVFGGGLVGGLWYRGL